MDDGQAGNLGERRLTTLHAIGQSLAIGPIFSLAGLMAIVYSAAGGNTPLSVLIGSLGVLALGWVISVYARRFSGAGAIYEYLTHGARPAIGVFGAGVYLLGCVFLGGGGVYLIASLFLQGFWSEHISDDGSAPRFIIFAVLVALAVFVFNHFGVRLAVGAVLGLAAVSAIPVIIASVVAIAQGGESGNTLDVFNPGTTSWNAVFKGILFAVTLFIGFEAAASLGEETANPRRSIPIAVMATITIGGLFYLLVSYALTIGLTKEQWGDPRSPIVALADRYLAHWVGTLTEVVIILDTLSVAIAFTVAIARVLMALARDGLLPRPLAITSKHATPLGGNVAALVIAVLFCLVATRTHYGRGPTAETTLPENLAFFNITVAAGSYLIELVYVFLALAAFGLVLRRSGFSWWQPIALVAALATPLLAFKGSLDPWPSYPANRGVYFALVCLVVVAAWLALLWVTKRGAVRNAASHAAQHHGVEPTEHAEVHA